MVYAKEYIDQQFNYNCLVHIHYTMVFTVVYYHHYHNNKLYISIFIFFY